MMQAPSVFHVDRLELSFAPKPWAFAVERRAEIDAYFSALRREKPHVWNGRVLLMHDRSVENGVLHGQYLETDYASFSAWCHWNRPAAGVGDCFSAAAILSADGAFLLGVMGPHTFNGGRIYFPCGTPDPAVIVDGKVDLDLSLRRELKEETGLDMTGFEPEPGWTMSVDGALIAQVKVLRSKNRPPICAGAFAHILPAKKGRNSPISISYAGPAISIPPCRAMRRLSWHRDLPAGSSRLPDQGDQSETGGVAILCVAGQILFQEAFLVEESPEKHGYQHEGDQAPPIRAKRERGREKQ